MRGECGVGPLSAVESPLDPNKGGGQVHETTAEQEACCDTHGESPSHTKPNTPTDTREVRFLRRALHEATSGAQLNHNWPCDSSRCAVLLGTTLHGMRSGGSFLRSGDFTKLKTFLAGASLRNTFRDFPSLGLTATTCSACSSGLASISLAHTLLQAGEADLVIAGGYDTISEYAYAGFNAMRLVSPTHLQPFGKHRDGMKVAEGYAIVALEREASARKRGVTPIVTIAGYGESCDAHHLSKPHPEGAGASAAMRQALSHANLKPADIDLLVAHATATFENDKSEHAALAQVFGQTLREVPVVGFKSHLGHSLGAAGTVDLILAAMAIRDGVAPPCANTKLDSCAFEDMHLSTGEKRRIRHVLNTSLGFGGANCCMVISATPPTKATIEKSTIEVTPNHGTAEDVVITGVGIVAPNAIGQAAFSALLSSHFEQTTDKLVGAIDPQAYEHLINARRSRRMSRYAKMCLAATTLAFRDAAIDDMARFGETCGAIVGATHAAVEYCETYYRQLIAEGIDAANPALFAEGVPNVASAHLSTNFHLKGFCQTIIGTRTAGLEALQLAATRIRAGVWSRVIVCAAQEHNDLIDQAYRTLIGDTEFGSTEGAVTFILESRSSAQARGATIRAVITKTVGSWINDQRGRRRIHQISHLTQQLGTLDVMPSCGAVGGLKRLEQLSIRKAQRRIAPPLPATVNHPCDQWGEIFGVAPLAKLASAIIMDKPSYRLDNTRVQDCGHERESKKSHPRRVGVVCCDDNGSACGVAIELV